MKAQCLLKCERCVNALSKSYSWEIVWEAMKAFMTSHTNERQLYLKLCERAVTWSNDYILKTLDRYSCKEQLRLNKEWVWKSMQALRHAQRRHKERDIMPCCVWSQESILLDTDVHSKYFLTKQTSHNSEWSKSTAHRYNLTAWESTEQSKSITGV